jgi:hypothetical protein
MSYFNPGGYSVSGNKATYSSSFYQKQGYSVLESMVQTYDASNASVSYQKSTPELIVEPEKTIIYDKASSEYKQPKSDYQNNHRPEDFFKPEMFLSPGRKDVQFVKATEEVKELVEKTFHLLTGKPLPKFNIMVCTPDEMKQNHPGWVPAIRGFAIPQNQSIFAVEAPIDELLLTIGHEIGHLLTKQLDDAKDEEAKAFAFARAWAETIKENDVGGLGNNIKIPAPAANGLHDKALEYVNSWLKAGESPLSIFYMLSSGYMKNR